MIRAIRFHDQIHCIEFNEFNYEVIEEDIEPLIFEGTPVIIAESIDDIEELFRVDHLDLKFNLVDPDEDK